MWVHSCAHLKLRVHGMARICALSAPCVQTNNRCSAPKIFGGMRPACYNMWVHLPTCSCACVAGRAFAHFRCLAYGLIIGACQSFAGAPLQAHKSLCTPSYEHFTIWRTSCNGTTNSTHKFFYAVSFSADYPIRNAMDLPLAILGSLSHSYFYYHLLHAANQEVDLLDFLALSP
jgi:hypothetical protein